jgi:hypothetical protein
MLTELLQNKIRSVKTIVHYTVSSIDYGANVLWHVIKSQFWFLVMNSKGDKIKVQTSQTSLSLDFSFFGNLGIIVWRNIFGFSFLRDFTISFVSWQVFIFTATIKYWTEIVPGGWLAWRIFNLVVGAINLVLLLWASQSFNLTSMFFRGYVINIRMLLAVNRMEMWGDTCIRQPQHQIAFC